MVPEGRDPHGTLISGMIYIRGQLLQLHRSKAGDYSIEGKSLRITYDHLPQPQVDLYLLSLGRTNAGSILEALEERNKEYVRVGVIAPTGRIDSQISLLKT